MIDLAFYWYLAFWVVFGTVAKATRKLKAWEVIACALLAPAIVVFIPEVMNLALIFVAFWLYVSEGHKVKVLQERLTECVEVVR